MNSEFQNNALSPLDGRYHSQTKSLSNFFSEKSFMRFRLQIEVEWLIQLASDPNIPQLNPFNSQQIAQLQALYHEFSEQDMIQIKALESKIHHDIKAVEYFLRDKLDFLELGHAQSFTHFACTSEDINNLAYACMIKQSLDQILIPQFSKIIASIQSKSNHWKNIALLSRTHGQPATPTTLGKEFYNFYYRLQRQFDQLNKIEILGKFNGAVGNFNAHFVAYPQIDWRNKAQKFVESFGLTYNPYTTQIEPHDYLAELFHCFERLNCILLDLCKDVWGYIAFEVFVQKSVDGQVGSSTMPHKINPIHFENAEGNLGLANALLSHLSQKLPISRWQRDLSDSSVLRNVGSIFGYIVIALNSIEKGMQSIAPNDNKIKAELENHWEVLTEALQTVERKHSNTNAYEKTKELSRGKKITGKEIHQYIQNMEIPENEKNTLLNLIPSQYIGLANQFDD